MQFLGKFGKIIGWRSQLWGWLSPSPTFRVIPDPALDTQPLYCTLQTVLIYKRLVRAASLLGFAFQLQIFPLILVMSRQWTSFAYLHFRRVQNIYSYTKDNLLVNDSSTRGLIPPSNRHKSEKHKAALLSSLIYVTFKPLKASPIVMCNGFKSL